MSSSRASCLGAALDLLSRRQMTTQALIKKLREKGYLPDEIEGAVDRLTEWKYLDDRSFSTALIKNKREKYSKRSISCKLCTAGIDRQTIHELLAEHYPDETEAASCLLVAKKLLPLEQKKWQRKFQKRASQDNNLHDSDLHESDSFEENRQEFQAGDVSAAVYRGMKEKLVRRGYGINTVDAVLFQLIERDNY